MFLTLERENLIDQAAQRRIPQRLVKESRGALAHKDFPGHDDETGTKHTLPWLDEPFVEHV